MDEDGRGLSLEDISPQVATLTRHSMQILAIDLFISMINGSLLRKTHYSPKHVVRVPLAIQQQS